MNRFIATFSMSLVGLAMLISGCATAKPGLSRPGTVPPIHKPVGTPSMPPMSTPQMNLAPSPAMPSVPTPALPTAPNPAATNSAAVTTANPIAQVGFFRDRCGCGACVECQSPQPHGYVETSMQGWNAYGIDPQEFVCDGGDKDPRARLLLNDQVDGLQGEDTVVHYTTEAGDIKFQPSNRTCVYSPSFASVRRIASAVSGEKTIGLSNLERPMGPHDFQVNEGGVTVRDTNGPEHADVARRLDALRDRNRGVPVENVLQPTFAARILPPLATMTALEIEELKDEQLALVRRHANAAIAWSVDESVEIAVEDLKAPSLTRDQKLDSFTVYEFPDAGRLRILKMADRTDAQRGDTITFSIRVENVGDSVVNRVVMIDNLVTRLEYIEQSQTSTVEADFEAVQNSERSLRLQWSLKGPLAVGESATVEFKCRVR